MPLPLYGPLATAEETARALAVARLLLQHGARLFLLEPILIDGAWAPRAIWSKQEKRYVPTGGDGYQKPRDWQHTPYNPDVVNQWIAAPEPKPALAMVCGHVFGAVDNDPRNGGDDVYALLEDAMPPILMTQDTPSSGQHHLIAALGVRKTALAGVDIQDGVANCDRGTPRCNGGHGFIYLAPTVKWSKTLECVASYRWVTSGQGLIAPNFDPALGQPLRERIVEVKISQAPARKANADGSESRGSSLRTDRAPDADRVFSPKEAARYIQTQVVDRLKGARQGTVATTLFVAGTQLGHFVPTYMSEVDAVDLLVTTLAQCQGNDGTKSWDEMHEIHNGLKIGQSEWVAKMVSGLDPLGHYDLAPGEPRPSGGARQSPAAHSELVLGEPSPPPGPCFLPEEFWAARPLFQHLRKVAWAAMESPEGVLLAGIALIASRTAPNIIVGAPVGAPASLNHMFVVCGDPGDGKSVCKKLAQRALVFEHEKPILPDGTPWPASVESFVAPYHSFGPSSGQGIAGQFQRLVKERGAPPQIIRTRHCAMATVDESDTIGALMKNPLSTLGADLRKGAMGEELSYGNIGDTQTFIPEHGYRLIFWMCMQPELSGWLLGTSGGGLPQRFVWICVRDPRIVEGYPAPAERFVVKLPPQALLDATKNPAIPQADHIMGFTERIGREIRDAKKARKELGAEAGQEYDGHAILNRFKLAGHLAVADGRIDHSDEDWALAGMIMNTSRATLTWVQDKVSHASAEEARKVALGRGKSRIIEEAVVSTHGDTAARRRVSAAVLRFLSRVGADGMPKSDLRRKLQQADRHILDAGVLDALMESGQVRFEDITRGDSQSGSRWFITGSGS